MEASSKETGRYVDAWMQYLEEIRASPWPPGQIRWGKGNEPRGRTFKDHGN